MKTAVEYFNQEIKELFNMHQDGEISGKMFHMSRLVALTKAKQMEKEQSHKYAEFAIRCDRKDIKILNFEDWIKL